MPAGNSSQSSEAPTVLAVPRVVNVALSSIAYASEIDWPAVSGTKLIINLTGPFSIEGSSASNQGVVHVPLGAYVVLGIRQTPEVPYAKSSPLNAITPRPLPVPPVA